VIVSTGAARDRTAGGQRRKGRRVMRAGLVLLAASLAVAGAAASASGRPREPVAAFGLQTGRALVPLRAGAGSQTYGDRVGDAVNGAPDISSVAVANDDPGNITVSVTLANHSSDFQPNEGILVVMDTDGNSATGNGGIDYVYAGVKDHTGLFYWNGSSFAVASAPTLQSATASGQISFRINRSDLGNTTALNFYVETTRDNGVSIGDDAPDGSGVFTYRLVLPAAPPPPPTTTTTPPAPAPRFVVSPVGLPHPGRRFVVRARILLGAQSVSPSALGCAAKVGSSAVRTTAVNGPAPYRSCVVVIPVRSTGKSVTVTLLVQYKTSGTTRRLTYKIR
jgi:hypothetical protein